MSQFEDNVKLEDAKAQYQSVLGNIAIANTELEKVLAAIEVSNDELVKSEKELAYIQSEKESILVKNEGVKEDTIARINAAIEKENTADLKSAEAATRLEQIAVQHRMMSNKINDLFANTEGLTEHKKSLEECIKSLSDQLTTISNNVTIATENLNSINTELSEAKVSHEVTMEAYNKEISEIQNTIQGYRDKAQEEQDKITNYEDHVAADRAMMVRRESDIGVVTRRLQKLYQEFKPGTNLKI